MKSAPGIAFDYRPSRQLGGVGLAVATLALLAPWLSGLPWPASLLLSLAVLALATRSLTRFMRPAFRRIAWHASGWVLVDAAGNERPAELRRHARFGAWLVLLDFRHATRTRFHALIAPDNLDADTRRRLILLLCRAEVIADGSDSA